MKKTISFFMLLGVFIQLAIAQDKSFSLADFKAQTGGEVSVNRQTGTPEFIRFSNNHFLQLSGSTLIQKVNAFFQFYPIFKHADFTQDFDVQQVKEDRNGFKTVILLQKHNEVPIFDGVLKFHFNNENELTAINGNYLEQIKISSEQELSVNQANAIAINEVQNQGLNGSGIDLEAFQSDLMYFQKGLVQNNIEGVFLVYKVEVTNKQDVREFVFVDAHTGQIVEQFTGMAHTLNRELYEANTFNLIWEEGDPFPGTLDIWQQNEVEATGHIYHLMNNAFGYDSFDDAGATMITINNNPNINCPNANWNGFTTNYCDGTASDDAIAHEWGHAYTQYTSGLIYAYQSGAINESFSDVWGETVDLINEYEDEDEDLSLRTICGSSDRWIIGEDASSLGGGNGIRDMWLPTCYGNAGKVTDIQYYCGSGDSGGVHLNSGVPNHAYALLVDGGSYNGYAFSGLGLTKSAHIFWRAQSEYLTATSDFYNLADALEAACTDLIGVNLEGLSTTSTPAGLSGEILSEEDLTTLQEVLLAVELRLDTNCGYETLLAETEDPCEAAGSNPIFFEDWENGLGDWTATELPENPSTWESRNWIIESNLPDGRDGQGIFASDPVNGDCNTDLQNGILRLESPVITIPDYPTGTFEMMFAHNMATEFEWDGGNIKYSLNGGEWTLLPLEAFTANGYNDEINGIFAGNDNPMSGQVAFTGTDEGSASGSWGRSYVDLSSIGVLPNDTLQLRWELGTDGCNGRVGWYLDEIAIYNCEYLLSINDNQLSSLSVYPNPSNGSFYLTNPQGQLLEKADIFDINGRLIQTVKLGAEPKHEIRLEGIASGIYFMNIQSNSANEVIKLIVE
ncbi:M4 family metallopeptidase [Mangrovimonas futianensis]|uniref:M4 family metallopeptidase n=1 Tax=Mangrovimonas futianensis TaxID=2895523 RepID=UPI001E5DFF60|nr:M4 family metallopeptidase [Mangrovimonas futianensis]MCF1422214.1 M4 family metallopeptidase [Mangrovimonas futianensis]